MIAWILPLALVAVGFITGWKRVPMIDVCWLYNTLLIGLVLAMAWRGIPQKVAGWKIACLFASVLIWPIFRAYGPLP